MKITERDLMVGDWVMVAECVADAHFVEYPDKIESIRDGLVGLESDGLETIIERVDPIPLTAEILDKNGFEAFDYFLKIQINSTLIELRPIQGNMAIWLDWNEDNDGVYADFILPYPKYLHELQHALQLAGIDKEITI